MRSLLQRVKEKEAKSSGERLKRTKREKKLCKYYSCIFSLFLLFCFSSYLLLVSLLIVCLAGRVQKKPSKKHVSETQKNFLEDNVAALKESSAEASSQSVCPLSTPLPPSPPRLVPLYPPPLPLPLPLPLPTLPSYLCREKCTS